MCSANTPRKFRCALQEAGNRSEADAVNHPVKREKPFRFVRDLRVQDYRAGENAHRRRCLPKLEAGNRGADGWIYGESRMLVDVVCDTINGWRMLSILSQRLEGSFHGVQRQFVP